jgi:hypothetical protein
MIVKVIKDDKIKRFCSEHISYMRGGILMKLHRNVHHYEKLCCLHEPGLSVKGQGHTLRSSKMLVAKLQHA